jgi:hypothetical protein
VPPTREINNEFSTFLTSYRRTQRAIWADDDNEFRDALNALVQQIGASDIDFELQQTEAFVAASLVEAGSDQELDFDGVSTEVIQSAVRELLELPFDEIIDEARREKRIRRKEKITIDINDEDITSRINNQHLRPEVKFLMQDWRKYIEPTNLRPEISGSVQSYDSNVIIRLTVNPITLESLNELQQYVERQIRRLRGPRNDASIEWREEYVQLGERKQIIGYSWDLFPFPHIVNHTPGITAWRSNEGRAEIIVRPSRKLGS